MTVAILLVACAVLAAAVVALTVSGRRLEQRLAALEDGRDAEVSKGSRQARPAFGPGHAPDEGAVGPGHAPDEAAVGPGHAPDEAVVGPGHAPDEPVETPTGRQVPGEYVTITALALEPSDPAPALETKLFADVVLRETVVKAASFAYGLRRGLAPANRNRIWFEMRREVKRARKHRKAEEREAIREWRARRRAGLREENAA